MFTKTVLALSAAVVLAGSTAALAETYASIGTRISDDRMNVRAAFAQALPGRHALQNGVSFDSVLVDGQIIGRDPDANVRLNLRRDQPWKH
jgi:hypothetical protein